MDVNDAERPDRDALELGELAAHEVDNIHELRVKRLLVRLQGALGGGAQRHLDVASPEQLPHAEDDHAGPVTDPLCALRGRV